MIYSYKTIVDNNRTLVIDLKDEDYINIINNYIDTSIRKAIKLVVLE